MRIELSSLDHSVSRSTQAAPYTHACRNRLLFVKRERGIFKLHVGVHAHSGHPVFYSPLPKGPG